MNKPTEKYSLWLATSEIGLGSVIHGLHLPLGGHVLSINQSTLLTLLAKEVPGKRKAAGACFSVSAIGAALKLLSPMGKKITPMFAIFLQGLFFSGSVWGLGANLLGIGVGTVLLCLWGFVQSVVFAYLFFGKTLVDSLLHFNLSLTHSLGLPPESLLWVFATLLSAKLGIALTLNGYAWNRTVTFTQKYQATLTRLRHRFPAVQKARSARGPLLDSLLDLWSPWFLFSLALTAAYLVFVQSADWKAWLLYLVRPTFFAWLSFWAIRAVTPRLSGWLVAEDYLALPVAEPPR